jgi:hypothetical protein
MEEKTKSRVERFNEFFNTRRLLMIIGLLMGVIASRLLGVQ